MLLLTRMRDTALARSLLWRWSARGVWLGPVAFALSLLGMELLRRESLRIWALLLLVGAAVMAVLAWNSSRWSDALPVGARAGLAEAQLQVWRRRCALATLAGAVFLSALSHLTFLAAPHETFGAAGWLWLAGIAMVVAAAALRSLARSPQNDGEADGPPAWTWWEVAVVASIAILALALRVWDLRDVPFNIYPDEIMTGLAAERAYINGAGPAPCLFSTLWSDIELPALWFAIVAGALKLGGIGLAAVRLPAALFGAATVLPFYGFVRGAWGRIAAIAGASIMAFSAANVHYSRMALNNITTPFFWAVCFFFIMRGLRRRRPHRLDAGRARRRCKRTFLLRHTPPFVYFDRVCRLSLSGSLVRRTTIPRRHRMADFGIPDRLRAAPELLRDASRLVLRTGRGSNDLESNTRELARHTTDVEHASADHVRESSRHQHSQCTGHHVLRSAAAGRRGRAACARSSAAGVAMAAPGGVSRVAVWAGGTLRRRHADILPK